MNAEKYLEQVRKLEQLIAAKNEERRRLLLIAEDCSARMPDGMPFSNTGMVSRRVENAVIDLVILAKEVDKAVARYKAHLANVLENLEKLPAKEYGVLHRHYIQYKPWEKVAEEMGYSTTHIWRIKQNGLKILQDVIECNAKGVI